MAKAGHPRADPEKCTHQYDEKQGNNNTRALSTNCLLWVQEDIQKQKTNFLQVQKRIDKELLREMLKMNTYLT